MTIPLSVRDCAVLEEGDDCRVVGEAADGLTALEVIGRLQSQVAILDVQLPDLNGLEVARRVHTQLPTTRIIMLSMYADESYVLDGGIRLRPQGLSHDRSHCRRACGDGRAPLSQRAVDGAGD